MRTPTLILSIAGLTLLAACSSSATVRDAAPHVHDHNAMTMQDMVDMLDGKTGDELDKAFLEGMIPHHQGAIDMAELLIQNAKHEELKQLGRDIIEAQQREIDMMKQWQHEWGYEH